jgi:hypothetical protein
MLARTPASFATASAGTARATAVPGSLAERSAAGARAQGAQREDMLHDSRLTELGHGE